VAGAALNRDGLPREKLLEAFVYACGGSDDEVGGWLVAWRRLAARGADGPQVRDGRGRSAAAGRGLVRPIPVMAVVTSMMVVLPVVTAGSLAWA
jgi:hypothetical protein